MNKRNSSVNGVLLIYYQHIAMIDASTVHENIESFEKHSTYPTWSYNVALGFPNDLMTLEFDVIVLHYSLFSMGSYYTLSQDFLEYIQHTKGHKVAFFQDDYRYCQKRFNFINTFQIDTIYTPLQPENIPKVYGSNTNAKYLFNYLCGYVCTDIIEKTKAYVRPWKEREMDISYRARQLPYYLGSGGQEKHLIGLTFIDMCKKKQIPLNLDIKINFNDRIYGNDWYQFLGNSKAVLGVESGGSIVDIEDIVVKSTEEYLKTHPKATFEEFYDVFLHKYDNNILYRVSSPRIFESAALKALMIMYEGNYSGIIQPDVHYIALKKDFSNFDDIIAKLHDTNLCKKIIDNAYQDLILSGKYSYRAFIVDFDKHLQQLGIIVGNKDDYTNVSAYFTDITRKQLKKKYPLALAEKYAKKYILEGSPLRKVLSKIYVKILKYS